MYAIRSYYAMKVAPVKSVSVSMYISRLSQSPDNPKAMSSTVTLSRMHWLSPVSLQSTWNRDMTMLSSASTGPDSIAVGFVVESESIAEWSCPVTSSAPMS